MKPIHIALDLDGTLAYYDEKSDISSIGEPILPMVYKVKEWLTKGYEVTLFSCRFRFQGYELLYQQRLANEFCDKVGIPHLHKTATKLREFTHFVDDKAYHVVKNKGQITPNIDL